MKAGEQNNISQIPIQVSVPLTTVQWTVLSTSSTCQESTHHPLLPDQLPDPSRVLRMRPVTDMSALKAKNNNRRTEDPVSSHKQHLVRAVRDDWQRRSRSNKSWTFSCGHSAMLYHKSFLSGNNLENKDYAIKLKWDWGRASRHLWRDWSAGTNFKTTC